MTKEVLAEAIQPEVHGLAMVKQIMESRSSALEILREAMSNMCTPEVGAKHVSVHFYVDPDYGGSFMFRDDGCGMTYTGSREAPGRLDRFIGLGFGGTAGLESDTYGWKGLGSKLMLNCRKLEVNTWTGNTQDHLLRVEVHEPRSRILQDVPEWPSYVVFRQEPDVTCKIGTAIRVLGFDGGSRNYSLGELEHYLYWNTVVGITSSAVELPQITLKVGVDEKVMEPGYRWIRARHHDDADAWKAVIVDPPITVTESASNGALVEATLKGGFTLITGDACGPGISLSRHRRNTGLRLSVMGIPYFQLDFGSLKGSRFQQYKDLCSFVVECDQLATKLNIDRSGYNRDDETVRAFEQAVTKAFNILADRREYREFNERKRREDERSKSKYLNSRKERLSSPDQEYVAVRDEVDDVRVLHRVPDNEQDTLALFWKLEGMRALPFAQFETLEHTNKSGIDVIANYQEEEDGQLRLMESVEFEHTFENFQAHAHNPRQTGLLVCWQIRSPQRLHKVKDYLYRAIIGSETITVVELRALPGLELLRRSEF